jgi:hypothetical protein
MRKIYLAFSNIANSLKGDKVWVNIEIFWASRSIEQLKGFYRWKFRTKDYIQFLEPTRTPGAATKNARMVSKFA